MRSRFSIMALSTQFGPDGFPASVNRDFNTRHRADGAPKYRHEWFDTSPRTEDIISISLEAKMPKDTYLNEIHCYKVSQNQAH